MSQTNTREINGKTVTIHPNLDGFKLFKKSSTNVDYFGTYLPHEKEPTGQLFMQFLTGKCYVYTEVPKETLAVMESSESIGKAYYQFIKGKFPEQEVGVHLITTKHSDEDEDDWDPDEDLDLEGELED